MSRHQIYVYIAVNIGQFSLASFSCRLDFRFYFNMNIEFWSCFWCQVFLLFFFNFIPYALCMCLCLAVSTIDTYQPTESISVDVRPSLCMRYARVNAVENGADISYKQKIYISNGIKDGERIYNIIRSSMHTAQTSYHHYTQNWLWQRIFQVVSKNKLHIQPAVVLVWNGPQRRGKRRVSVRYFIVHVARVFLLISRTTQ